MNNPDHSEQQANPSATPYADYQPRGVADQVLETAEVVDTAPDGVWVQTRKKNGCAACARHGGCGVSIFQRVFGLRTHRMFVATTEPVPPGSQVVIAMAQQALIRGALWLYLVPLLALLVGAILGQWATGADWGAIILAGLGFWGAMVIVRRRESGWRNQKRFAPHIHEVVFRAAPPPSHSG